MFLAGREVLEGERPHLPMNTCPMLSSKRERYFHYLELGWLSQVTENLCTLALLAPILSLSHVPLLLKQYGCDCMSFPRLRMRRGLLFEAAGKKQDQMSELNHSVGHRHGGALSPNAWKARAEALLLRMKHVSVHRDQVGCT